MINTHINVGGHKITTNKVGQVHNITSSDLGANMSFVSGGRGTWCVTNGICFICLYGIQSSTTGTQAMLKNVPTPKIQCVMPMGNGGSAIITSFNCNAGATTVMCAINANSPFYGTVCYPVADDWVES